MTRHSRYMSLLSLRALRLAGVQRAVLVRGWAMLSEDVEGEPDAEELRAFCKEKAGGGWACWKPLGWYGGHQVLETFRHVIRI